jgi:hypothetical protein
MKFLEEPKYGRTRAHETYTYPKSLVKVGDIILPRDGSWTVCLKEGVFFNRPVVAYYEQPWKVIITEGNFPAIISKDLLQPKCSDHHYDTRYTMERLPGTVCGEIYSSIPGERWVIADLMCQALDDPNLYLFIPSRFVVLHG